jgi:tetratricopeptide (TPR) repeat protein
MRKRSFIVLLFTLLIIPSSIARAAPSEVIYSLSSKLDSWDVESAWAEVKELLPKEPKDPQLLELASHIAFHRGDYKEALKLIKSAVEFGGEEEKRKGFALFVEETIGVVTPFKRYESPHFIISMDEKQDGILIDYLLDALEKTYRLMAQQYDFQPREKIRIEIFPDTKAFYYASTLSARDIEVTGAVGMANFNKLMLLSPKALVYGYRWLDAISHEYMHYLIMKVTSNKAPIWFHEGLAKYEETHWRSGPSYASPLYQTLLVQALSERRLIGFERMEPSLVKLETPEEVQLAYAQAASAIEFIIAKAGHQGLKEMMTRMAAYNQRGASDPIKDIMGLSFSEFESNWKKFLASKGFKEVEGTNVRRYKIKEGKADEERLDMGEIKSLVAKNRAHLGDLLRERGRVEAAVLEYRRALADAHHSVPILNRLADGLILLGRNEEALDLLARAKEISPDHPTPYNKMGQIYLKLKDFNKAREIFQESIQINPFNPEVHRGLTIVYEALGEKANALREMELIKKLER